MISLTLNGEPTQIDAPAEMPLLWALRDLLQMTGTRFGCGMALCGACTVLMDGKPIRSCVTPLSVIEGQSITTIEGVESDPIGRKVQQAWLDEAVAQCGFCQSGQIVSAVGLLKDNSTPSDEEIDAAMGGNLCRCGTYTRIRKAIHRAASATTSSTDALFHEVKA